MSRPVILPWVEGLSKAVHVLRQGGVVAFPTETYYGLAADPRRESAVRRIFAIKRRADSLQLPLVAGHESDIRRLFPLLPAPVEELVYTGWPPAFSVILETPPGFPEVFGRTLAIRVSTHPVAAHLVRSFGFPVTSTSANRHNEPPASVAEDCAQLEVDLILDAGPTPGGLPSTLAQLQNGAWHIVRHGPTPPGSWSPPKPRPEWTCDKIPASRFFTYQMARGGYRFNLDSILLADFAFSCAPARVENFLDIGSGSGVCAFWLHERFPQAIGRGLEIDENACIAAQTAASMQHRRAHLEFIHGDLAHERALLPGGAFDLVISNPPYYERAGRVSRSKELQQARHEQDDFLKRALFCSHRALRPGGVAVFILPAQRLGQLAALALEARLSPYRFRFVHPRANLPANRVLAAFIKDRRPPLQVLPACIVHDENGYTPPVRRLLGETETP